MQAATPITLLKLGGSLITDKSRPSTARQDVLERIAQELRQARDEDESLRLLIGHGSGSFGHVPARQHNTREGVRTREDWQGFVEVWHAASTLNRFFMEALSEAGLDAVCFPPSAGVQADLGRIVQWDVHPLLAALQAGLVPVVYGDVAFDRSQGGTIVSTEEIFLYLAAQLQPTRVLIAGTEPGVWADYPDCTRLLHEVHPPDLRTERASLQGSAHTDVTGGMASKVAITMQIAALLPDADVRIFSGRSPGAITAALLGEPLGTRIYGETG